MPYGIPLQSPLLEMRAKVAHFEGCAADALKAADKHQEDADRERAHAEEYSQAAKAYRVAIVALETHEEAHP